MARTLDKKVQESYRASEEQNSCTLYADDRDVYPVDRILDIRARAVTTEIEYLIKWTGYSAKCNSWVTEQNVTPDLKRAFSRENKEKVIKMLKRQRAQTIRQKIYKITSSSTIKRENESFEEKPSQYELTQGTAMKNEGNVTPKSGTLSR